MRGLRQTLLVLFLATRFLPFFAGAQNCKCPEAAKAEGSSPGDPALEALKSSANIICRATHYQIMGIAFLEQRNSFDTAEQYFQQAEKMFRQSKCGDEVLLETYKQWAQLYYTKGDFARAQEFSLKLLQSAEAAKDPYEIGICYTMIAQLLNQTSQADKGIVYSRRAVPLIAKIDDPAHRADLLFKLSKRYLWHFQDTKTKSSLDSSELFSQQQLVIAKQINKNSSIAGAFGNLEGVAWEREDFKTALRYLDSSFRYTDTSNIGTLATNYFDKADLMIELGDYTGAEKMADSAMYYNQRMHSVSYIAESYELISRIASLKGDYRKAFETNAAARNITDSIKNVEKAKQVSELEKKYNQAKNERKIEVLHQQKKTYLFLVIAALFGLIALAFFIRQQSLKNKQRILETEQRLNRARMNPHFFFNALSTLQSFALTENDGKALASNLSKFSHIMRETLESTYKDYVTIDQEIDFLHEYLELQKMRFPQKFSYSVKAAQDMETAELMIPSMILQPFAENSIEHGFTGIDYPGFISIDFEKANADLIITMTDNGKGLLKTGIEKNGRTSRASQIIKDRIYLLNIKLKTKASFSIDTNKDNTGVTVKIILPVIYHDEVSKNDDQ